MNHLKIQAVLFLSVCPLLVAQQPRQAASPTTASLLGPAGKETVGQEAADAPQSSVVTERALAIKNARTICVNSETDFLTDSTLERALMKQKNWDALGLNIVGNGCKADLEIEVHRVVFTHIHTYVLTDKATGIVLAAGRVRALDGVIASGPMAEQIVKILSAARLPASTPGANRGL
jgi:hypothetical protein